MSLRSRAVILLQVFAAALFVIPSDAVIKVIGAGGYAAALVGMFGFAAFLTVSLLGLHSPLAHRHPIRAVLCLLWLSVLISYVLMDRNTLTVAELASADRLLMQLAVITGVALIAAEFLASLHDVRRVLRVLCWAGAFCGVVAAIQFWISLDVTPYLRDLPGFSINANDVVGIGTRNGLNRVSGTAMGPIDLGVVAGMLLPLAIYLAIYDTGRSARRRWAPVWLIALAIPASVSRSAIISVAVAVGVLVVLMPAAEAAGGPLRLAIQPRGRLHDGPWPDRHARRLLRGRDRRPFGGYPGQRLSAGRAVPGAGALVRSWRLDVHSGQCHKHPRQPVPEDRDRTGIGRGRRVDGVLPGADDFRTAR